MDIYTLINNLSGMDHASLIYFILLGILLLCGFGLPVPEDIILISGGYLSHLHILDIRIFLPLAMFGVLAGDSTMFMLGRKLGYPFLKKKFARRFISTQNLSRAEDAFEKYGDRIFFAARFLPGLRTPIYFTGGALNAKFYKFFLFDFFAAIISVPLWIFGAYYGGEYLERVIHVGKNVQFGIIAFILVLVLITLGWRFYKNRNGRKTVSE